jgi:hypothetical protein
MEPVEANEIRLSCSDPDMEALLSGVGEDQRPVSRHFNQSEDFFLLLEDEYAVPHISIHHDVRLARPSEAYMAALRKVTGQLTRLAPQVFKGLSYFFNPVETLRPSFYRLYTVGGSQYLYLLRVDLMMHAADGTVVERGNADITPHYRSRRLFLEASMVPLAQVRRDASGISGFQVKQTISATWIGERGRGYFREGIWMDADLTKFFSRLFLPSGSRTYPYYPYPCKYMTMCLFPVRMSPTDRDASAPALHQSLQFLLPVMSRVEKEMRAGFSEQMDVFRELKEQVPPAWLEPWKNIRVEAYLNDSEQKEFRIDI